MDAFVAADEMVHTLRKLKEEGSQGSNHLYVVHQLLYNLRNFLWIFYNTLVYMLCT